MSSYDPLAVVAAESTALAQAARRGLDLPVPSCPDWDVRALVQHVGIVQRFHASHVTRGVAGPPGGERPTAPDDDVVEWFEESTAILLGALQQLPADAPAWNWASQTPQVVGFWPRRMALEAAVHRWDAQTATGDATGFDLPVAEDGIDEVLFVFRPARLRHRPGTAEGVVRLELTDSATSWTVRVSAGDVAATSEGADAVLSGTATEVLLALWGRLPLGPLLSAGEEPLAAALQAG